MTAPRPRRSFNAATTNTTHHRARGPSLVAARIYGRGQVGYEETREDARGVTTIRRFSDACLLARARARIAAYRTSHVEADGRADVVARHEPPILAEAVDDVAKRLAQEMVRIGERDGQVDAADG